MASNRSLGTLTLDLVLKLGGYNEGWSKAERETDRRTRAIQQKAVAFGKSIGTALGLGFTAATTVLGVYIKNSIEAEKVQAQLMARIRDTGGAARRSLEQLNDQAERLSKVTIFDDEAVGEAQAMLLTFKDIQGLQFDKAVESVLDLATAMGTDLNSASLQLGKALNDPVKGLGALSRAGIQFSADQKQVIKDLVEVGDKAQAQDLILRELASQMGTAAEAARGTLSGALQGLKNDFANLLEGDVGGEGIKGTTEAINDLSRTINDPSIKRGLDDMAEGMISVVNSAIKVIAKLGEAGSALAEFFGDAQRRSTTMLQNQRTDLETEQFGLERRLKRFDAVNSVANPLGVFASVDRNQLAKVKENIAEIDRILEQRNKAMRFSGVTITVDSSERLPGTAAGATGGSGRQKPSSNRAKDMPNFAEEDRKALERMVRETAQAITQFDALAATLSGPLKEAEFQHQQNLQEITRLGKEAGKSTADINALKEQETERYDKQTEAITRQLDPVGQLIKDLDEELRLVGLTNAERETAIQLRGLEAEATQDQVTAIRQANEALAAEYQKVDFLDGWRGAFVDFFDDVQEGNSSLKDSFRNLFDDIGRMIRQKISEQLVDQLFGQMGSSSGGTAGGGWLSSFASIFSSSGSSTSSQGSLLDLFGSSWGFATGGYASPRSINRVNENGPEILRVGSKDYLLTGNRGGMVIPSHMNQPAPAGPMTLIFNNPVMADRRSDSQRQMQAARDLQKSARNR